MFPCTRTKCVRENAFYTKCGHPLASCEKMKVWRHFCMVEPSLECNVLRLKTKRKLLKMTTKKKRSARSSNDSWVVVAAGITLTKIYISL